MKGPDKTHEDCPDCGHKKCLSIWNEGGTYCHSCGKAKGKGKVLHVVESKHVAYRNIPLDIVEFYDIKTGFDSAGSEARREYKYPTSTKYRYMPKDFSLNWGFKPHELFAMDKFAPGSSTAITIVEGEDDAPAAYHMLNKRFPVVSLPSGTISSELIQNCSEYLQSFKEIVVCTDGDATGKAAAKRLATAFPNKVFLVDLGTSGYKDPQEYLENGKQKEFTDAWRLRAKHTPSGFWNTPKQFADIIVNSPTHEFIPTSITSLNTVLGGISKGHLTVLTGPEGQGKTEVLRRLEYDILKEHPELKIGVLHMEESKKTCLESYACYELGKNLRKKDHGVPEADIISAIDNLTKNYGLYLFDFHIDEDPLAILEKVRYLHVACDCDFIFIDPIQQLAYGTRRDQTEEQVLSQISVQLERLATELNIGIVMSTHVNDDGQTRSSRMIGKSASVRIDLQRDHMSPDADVRNTTFLSVSKNRPTGVTGFGGKLRFDTETFTIAEDI